MFWTERRYLVKQFFYNGVNNITSIFCGWKFNGDGRDDGIAATREKQLNLVDNHPNLCLYPKNTRIMDSLDSFSSCRSTAGCTLDDTVTKLEGKKILVIGTTSEVNFLDSIGIRDAFSITFHIPTLKTEDAKKVLQQLNIFSTDDVDSAAEALNDMPIKKLYMVVEMAAQGEDGGAAEAIYSGKEKIQMSHFYDCLQYVVRY